MYSVNESIQSTNKAIDETKSNARRLTNEAMKTNFMYNQAAQDYQQEYIQYFQDMFDVYIQFIKEVTLSTGLPFTEVYRRYDNNPFVKKLIDSWDRSANVLTDTMLSEAKLANKLTQASLDSSKNSIQYIKNNANVSLKINVLATKVCEEISTNAGLKSSAAIKQSVQDRQLLERYPSARFPKKIAVGDIAGLEVFIRTARISSVESVAPSSEQEVPIEVIVKQGTFEVIGNNYGTIFVPTKPLDSKPIVFSLRGKEEGLQNIEINFLQKGSPLGKLIISSLVVGSIEEEDSSRAHTALVNGDWRLPSVNRDPDITLYIIEKNKSTFEYDALLTGIIGPQRYPIMHVGPIEFHEKPEDKFRAIFNEIEKTHSCPEDIEETIRAKGKFLYTELFPRELKDMYWQISDKIESIRIISEEPWIPWEIIKPWREVNGSIKEDDFLCQRYAFSRWIEKREEIKGNVIDRVKVVVPTDTNLPNAVKERDWIKLFGVGNRFDVSTCSSYGEVIDTIRKGDFGILHFCTHGKYNLGSPESSTIILEEKKPLKPDRLIGELFGNGSSPLVFLNTCQAGAQGFSLTDIQGWAHAFIQCGASALIVPLWSVSDEAAYNFSTEFYRQISTGKTTLGEAVRRARSHCKKFGDPSWLAYQLYGHPNSQVKLGTV